MPIVNGFLQIKEKGGDIFYFRVSDIAYIHESENKVTIRSTGELYHTLSSPRFEQAEIYKVLGLLGIVPEVFGKASPETVNIAHVSV